jgi:hypothetical protein
MLLRRASSSLLVAALACAAACSRRRIDDGDEATAPAPAATPTPAAAAPRPARPPLPPPPPSGPEPREHRGAHRWSTAIGGTGADAVRAVAVDPGGDIVVTGYVSGEARAGAEALRARGRDILLARYAPDGALRWARALGGDGDDIGQAVALAPDGDVLVTGSFTATADLGAGPLVSAGRSDVLVARFGPAGEPRWTRSYGGGYEDHGYSIAVAPDGGIAVTGYLGDAIDFGGGELTSAGHADMFLVALAPTGEHRWSRRFGDQDDDVGRAVAIDPRGDIALVGDFHGALDVGGGPLAGRGNSDVVLARFDRDGNHLWSRSFGDAFPDIGVGVAVDARGDVAVTGTFELRADLGGGPLAAAGKKDVFVGRYTADGEHVWSHRIGAGDEDVGGGVAVDGFGNVAVAAWFWQTLELGGGAPVASAGKNDVLVAKYGADGALRWARGFGAAEPDFGRGVAFDRAGNLVVVGTFRGAVGFGGKPLGYAGGTDTRAGDGFVASFGP